MRTAAVLEPSVKIDRDSELRRAGLLLLYLSDADLADMNSIMSLLAEAAFGAAGNADFSFDDLSPDVLDEIAEYEDGRAETYGPFHTWRECVEAMEADDAAAR